MCHHYQAVSDTMFLVFANLVYTGAAHLTPVQYLPLLRAIPILVPLIHISLTGSVYTIVAVALERYTTMVEALSKVTVNLIKRLNNVSFYHSQLPCVMDGSS